MGSGTNIATLFRRTVKCQKNDIDAGDQDIFYNSNVPKLPVRSDDTNDMSIGFGISSRNIHYC